MNLKAWLKELRGLFLLFVALPVVLGSAVAYGYEPAGFSLFYCALSVVAMVSMHAGTVLLNDYFDFRSGADVVNERRTPYSGGSGLLPAKVLRPGRVLAAGLLFFGLSALIGFYLVFTRSPAILAIGLVGAAIGFFYTAPPLRLAYRGLGEPARLAATPLMVLGAFVVQIPACLSSHWGILAVVIAASLPPAFLNTAALYIFEFPDYEADRAVGKRNLVVRLGRRKAVYLFAALIVLAYLSLLMGIAAGLLPFLSGIALIALPLSVFACTGLARAGGRPARPIPYLKAASDAYVLATIALILAFLL